jgi:pyruvate kinase
LELADAVMVARGDLGVEMPPEEVPPLQRIVEGAADGPAGGGRDARCSNR